MKDRVSRRRFLKVAGVSLGFGALYRVAPLLGAIAFPAPGGGAP